MTLLTKLPEGSEALEKAYESIENLMKDITGYVDVGITCM